MNMREEFPILQDAEIKHVPWRLMMPHEAQAIKNHGQTLDKLAYRGGLTCAEALAVIEERRWHKMDEAVARAELKAWVEAHIATST